MRVSIESLNSERYTERPRNRRVLPSFCGKTAIRFGWIQTLLSLLVNTPSEGLVITGFEPKFARAGESVQIQTEGLEPEAEYAVRIAGEPMAVESLSAEGIMATIPSSAISGRVEIEQLPNGNTIETHLAYPIVQSVPASVDPALEGAFGRFEAVTAYGSAPLGSGSPNVDILKGGATPVFAIGQPGDPLLMAIATGSESSIIFSARSTAIALILSNGLFFEDDPGLTGERIVHLDSLPSVDAAARIIEEAVSAGFEYLDNPDLIEALGEAAETLISILTAEQSEETRSRDRLYQKIEDSNVSTIPYTDDVVNGVFDVESGHPRNILAPQNLRIFNSLDASAKELGVSREGLPIRYLEMAPQEMNGIVRFNPVDWLVNVYELDPSQFDFGINEVNQLEFEYTVLERIRDDPVARFFLPAPGGAADLIKSKTVTGVISSATSALGEALFPVEARVDRLALPLHRPGVYLIRAFSGSLFNPQNNMVAAMPEGVREKLNMLSVNVLQLLLQTSSTVIGGGDLLGGMDVADIANSVLNETLVGLARKEAAGQLTEEDVFILFTALRNALVGKASGTVIGKLGGEKFSMFLRFQGALLDAAGADERFRAIVSGSDCTDTDCSNLTSVHTVESAIIVVGDPFSPVITSFEPRRGHRGRVVRINGRGFSSDPDLNRVEFNAPLTTDPTEPLTAPGEVLSASPTSLVVEVPDNATAGIGPIRVQVLAASSTMGTVRGVSETSARLSPYDVFEVLDDPTITGINPSPAIAGSPVVLAGENFPDEIGHLDVVFDNGFQAMQILRAISDTEIMVQAPLAAGAYDLQIRLFDPITGRERLGPPFPFTIEPGSGQEGWFFTVNTVADSIAPDNMVTLREAMIWASGAGGIHNPTEGELQFISRGFPQRPVGEGIADTISVLNAASPGSPIVLNSPLPPVTGYDTFLFNGREIDGSSVIGDGLRLESGAVAPRKVSVSNVVLSGFQGNGMVLNGAEHGTFDHVTVNGCSGDGWLLQNGTSFNYFRVISGDQCDGHGVHLTGSGVHSNNFVITKEAFTNILIKGSTNGNGGWGVLVDNGAHGNTLEIGDSNENGTGGIGILGTSSTENAIGLQDTGIEEFLSIMGNTGGPGVRVEASRTSVRYLWIAGNGGDGVIAEGNIEQCRFDALRIGFDEAGTAVQNAGSGIHFKDGVHDSRIGLDLLPGFNAPPPTVVGGNRDHGVYLENVTRIRINYLYAGTNGGGAFLQPNLLNNGEHGIYLLNSSDCEIGNHQIRLGVNIIGSPNGAGICMEGMDTFGNRVYGTSIGQLKAPNFNTYQRILFTDTNRYGIRITGGAWGNVIGRRGTQEIIYDPVFQSQIGIMNSTVEVTGSSEAGILIESGGDPRASITIDDVPTGGNVVQNCVIGVFGLDREAGNEIGILLRDLAFGNRIGGSDAAEQNGMYGNRSVGLKVEDLHIPQPNLANKITGNLFRQNFLPGKRTERPPDLLTDPPDEGTGLGLLVLNSSNQPIGGPASGDGNLFIQTGTGIYVKDSTGIDILRNQVGADLEFQLFERNDHAGIILSDASNCTVGPGNFLLGNGTAFDPPIPESAAIVVHGGSGNRIIGNRIGVAPNGEDILGNQIGIFLDNTSDNRVGGVGVGQGNIIVASVQSGIVLQGAACRRNDIGGNHIGYLPDPFVGGIGPLHPNGGDGILLRNGANANRIGEMEANIPGMAIDVSAANRIYGNAGAGVRVENPGSTGNRILFNSISNNAGLGISTTDGGNTELPPPEITGFTGSKVFGTLDDTIPVGSVIQLYTDTGDEGLVFKSQANSTGGTFQLDLGGLVFDALTATVTDPMGNTSEFGQQVDAFDLNAHMELSRAYEPVLERRVPAGTNYATIGLFKATALLASVEVESVRFTASGDLNDLVSINSVYLFQDIDRDGVFSDPDRMIGGPSTFPTDNGVITFPLQGVIIEPFAPQQWILAVDVAGSAPLEAVASIDVESAVDIEVRTADPSTVPAHVAGVFPVRSDKLVIVGADDLPAYNAWLKGFFSPAERQNPAISGPYANPDNDPLNNFWEHVLGTHPRESGASPLTFAIDAEAASFNFPWSHAASGANWRIETSLDAGFWSVVDPNETISAGAEVDQILAEVSAPPGANGTWFTRVVISFNPQ